MTRYEQIALLFIILIAVGGVITLFERPGSSFDDRYGATFRVGSFVSVTASTSAEREPDCERLEPVLVSALHTLAERLMLTDSTVSLNDAARDALCARDATLTLQDPHGGTLVIEKLPNARGVPYGHGTDDAGTVVTLTGSFESSTTSVTVLIPDRHLDAGRLPF